MVDRSKSSSIDPFSSNYSHPRTAIFVDIKAINLDVRRDCFCQRPKRGMKAQRGRDQINQRRLVADLTLAEQFCGPDVAAAAMRFDPAPVVDSLKDMLAIL